MDRSTSSEITLPNHCLMFFYASWHSPSVHHLPILEKIIESHQELVFLSLKSGEHSALFKRFKINEVPTYIYFREGEILWKSCGIKAESEILHALK